MDDVSYSGKPGGIEGFEFDGRSDKELERELAARRTREDMDCFLDCPTVRTELIG